MEDQCFYYVLERGIYPIAFLWMVFRARWRADRMISELLSLLFDFKVDTEARDCIE